MTGWGAPSEPGPTTPTRFTTPLLEMITQQSLDADYEVAAVRRDPHLHHAGGHRRRRHVGAIVIALGFGLLVAVAAVQTGRNADVDSQGREQLISRINERRAVVDDQQARILDLRAERARVERTERALGRRLAEVETDRDNLALVAGWSPLTGNGVRAVLADNSSTGEGGFVQDGDLALLVDALWHSGARAISVNGQRLTALSAFRNSAEVIRLNGVSLSPPYVVIALGNEGDLARSLESTTSGREFTRVVRSVGLGFNMDNENDLEVPAAPQGQMKLRYATGFDAAARSGMKEAGE